MSDEEEASPAALADLARAGFLMARQSLMQVNFEVHHVLDRGGYLRDLFDDRVAAGRSRLPQPDHGVANGSREAPPPPGQTPRETLSAAAHGVGLVIGTYVGALPQGMQRRRRGSDLPVALRVDDRSSDSWVFQGTAWPNPTFIYESGQKFEGLILIQEKTTRWSSFQSRAIAELIAEVSRIAAEHKAPLLSVQGPVQLPARPDDAEWPVPSVVAVRFAMALRRAGAERRLKLSEAFAEFAGKRGYGFWRADIRPGHRQGNWYLVRPHDRSRAEQYAARARWDDAEPRCSLPITFVGPARVGSTSAIMSYLREFPELGVLACSIISLDDLAFIHLQLAVNRLPPGGTQEFESDLRRRVRSAGGDDMEGRTSAPQDLLPEILPLVTGNGNGKPGLDKLTGLTDRAGDYQALTGPTMLVRHEGNDRIPLWFSWRAAGTDDGLAAPLIAFMDALAVTGLAPAGGGAKEIGDQPNLDYLVCRDVGESTLRGRGKITLSRRILRQFADTRPDVIGPRISTNLEDAWRVELGRYALPGGVEVSVAWMEYRLNNSTTLM
ncbi:hypothetical protein Q2K19_32100 [Micromonospora soli]|uniref:hypothetical protein n=1 Tax=Micromonospora sp. NBRC 110009 TaxID=3061627 RepID=UPI002673DBE8|nr:hypothetical protein [Micromonospora sp. NBRC 110009]WKT98728.1 hypothetical protein Q2K19_32100 [Micromonospora sp. NBRC 110009]